MLKTMRRCAALLMGLALPAAAAEYPAPTEATWVARDFRFHTGELLPELKLAYSMLGNPQGEPVLVLHGTGGSAASMLNPAFAGELFGPGQPPDARRHSCVLVEAVRQDPDYNGGNYSAPPRGLKMAAPFTADANDFAWQWDTSRDDNPGLGLKQIRAALLAINSADDERNPPELGTMARDLAQVRNGSLLLIPASSETRGHGTTAFAKFWMERFAAFIAAVPRLAP